MSTKVITISGATMGTRFSVQFHSAGFVDVDAIQHDLQQAVDQVDQQMSPWIETSVVNQINDCAIGERVLLPPATAEVLSAALEIEERSGGAFSCSVGAQVDYWGYGPCGKLEGDLPDMPSASSHNFEFDGAYLRKLVSARIDLCGIAKGYGVDQLCRILMAHEITNYFVSIDGEIRCAGRTADDTSWRVGLEAPTPDKREIEYLLDCHDLSLATSGGYRHFDQSQDQVTTHTICPKSGFPLSKVAVSVTVAHKDCCDADGWATAFQVMGVTDAIALAGRLGMHILFMDYSEETPITEGTGIFSKIFADVNP